MLPNDAGHVHRAKAIRAIMKNKNMAKSAMDAWDAPIGSTRRARVSASMKAIHKGIVGPTNNPYLGSFDDGKGGPSYQNDGFQPQNSQLGMTSSVSATPPTPPPSDPGVQVFPAPPKTMFMKSVDDWMPPAATMVELPLRETSAGLLSIPGYVAGGLANSLNKTPDALGKLGNLGAAGLDILSYPFRYSAKAPGAKAPPLFNPSPWIPEYQPAQYQPPQLGDTSTDKYGIPSYEQMYAEASRMSNSLAQKGVAPAEAQKQAQDAIKKKYGVTLYAPQFSKIRVTVNGVPVESPQGEGAGAGTAAPLDPHNIGGFDISTYATDPNHEAKVAAILQRIGKMTSVEQMDAYIQSVAPGSPVTGAMIAAASAKAQVPWETTMAMMQQDSSFGTAGLGARTFNPGNVGNTDSGATRNYGDWQAGVDAVAGWLANHRTGGGGYLNGPGYAGAPGGDNLSGADVVGLFKSGGNPALDSWYNGLDASAQAFYKPQYDALKTGNPDAWANKMMGDHKLMAQVLGLPESALANLPTSNFLGGDLRDLQKVTMARYGLDDQLKRIGDLEASGAHYQTDLSAYIRGKDKFLGKIDDLLQKTGDKIANMDITNPEVAKRMENYMSWLTVMRGRQNQRYTDYVQSSLTYHNDELGRLKDIYTTTYQNAQNEYQNTLANAQLDQATYASIHTQLTNMYTNWETRAGLGADAQKAQMEAWKTSASTIASMAKVGYVPKAGDTSMTPQFVQDTDANSPYNLSLDKTRAQIGALDRSNNGSSGAGSKLSPSDNSAWYGAFHEAKVNSSGPLTGKTTQSFVYHDPVYALSLATKSNLPPDVAYKNYEEYAGKALAGSLGVGNYSSISKYLAGWDTLGKTHDAYAAGAQAAQAAGNEEVYQAADAMARSLEQRYNDYGTMMYNSIASGLPNYLTQHIGDVKTAIKAGLSGKAAKPSDMDPSIFQAIIATIKYNNPDGSITGVINDLLKKPDFDIARAISQSIGSQLSGVAPGDVTPATADQIMAYNSETGPTDSSQGQQNFQNPSGLDASLFAEDPVDYSQSSQQ